jgi:hypothetical protein
MLSSFSGCQIWVMSSYSYNMSEAEPYQRLEAEFGGWGEGEGGVGAVQLGSWMLLVLVVIV